MVKLARILNIQIARDVFVAERGLPMRKVSILISTSIMFINKLSVISDDCDESDYQSIMYLT